MNTTTQKLAAVFGVVFVLVAIAGFIGPGGMAMQPTDPGGGHREQFRTAIQP